MLLNTKDTRILFLSLSILLLVYLYFFVYKKYKKRLGWGWSNGYSREYLDPRTLLGGLPIILSILLYNLLWNFTNTFYIINDVNQYEVKYLLFSKKFLMNNKESFNIFDTYNNIYVVNNSNKNFKIEFNLYIDKYEMNSIKKGWTTPPELTKEFVNFDSYSFYKITEYYPHIYFFKNEPPENIGFMYDKPESVRNITLWIK